MKKIIALLLATLMLVSLLACGEKKNETDNEQSGVEDEIPNDDANKEETELLYQQLKNTCEAYGTKVTIDEDGLFVFTKIEEEA